MELAQQAKPSLKRIVVVSRKVNAHRDMNMKLDLNQRRAGVMRFMNNQCKTIADDISPHDNVHIILMQLINGGYTND